MGRFVVDVGTDSESVSDSFREVEGNEELFLFKFSSDTELSAARCKGESSTADSVVNVGDCVVIKDSTFVVVVVVPVVGRGDLLEGCLAKPR